VAGYFLRAWYHFKKVSKEADCELVHNIQRLAKTHKTVLLETNPYAGLPELTNRNGKECHSGCPTQAWSFATILDVLNDLKDDILQCSCPHPHGK
jgi:glycogen debranching enzyme